MQVHRNSHDITVVRLHYMADPEKAAGEKIYVKEIDRELTPWAYNEYRHLTDPNAYLREYEIEAEAALGRLIYNLDEEATVEESYPLDPSGTRRMALDPHPSVPHAFLWMYTNRWGEHVIYREWWPSKVCYLWDGGKKIGKSGPCPEDEPVISIRNYVETVKWLESSENPENCYDGKPYDEHITTRVIDYTARAFGKGTNDDPEMPNFQTRYEGYMRDPKLKVSCPYFQDAKKDHDVGFEMVNSLLKPRLVENNSGEMVKRSKLRIFGDRCPELIHQMKNYRRKVLTPTQAAAQDPSGQAVSVRAHLCDDLRYLAMCNPVYIDQSRAAKTNWHPQTGGIAY